MKKQFKKTLFLFRRDLRLEDNTGLIFALRSSETVIPAFIFTREQIEQNPYRSDHCLKFMIQSLLDLEEQLKKKGGKLYLFKGQPEEVVKSCITKLSIDALILNRDYTPYSTRRDAKLAKVCKDGKIAFLSFDDALLHPPEEILKEDGKPYTLFTPYFRKASKQKVLPPVPNRYIHYFRGPIHFAEERSILTKIMPHVETSLAGGRDHALKILKKLGSFKQYGRVRDFPGQDCCTHLSPYLKFTLCSPREAHKAIAHSLGAEHELIRSLYWRDFFIMIAYYFPHVFKGAFRAKYDNLKWSYNRKAFKRWCEGSTGFPIVDAGMREMNQTGFMHNRVRMIAASFLVKDLHIDWRWGEKYFAQTLIDYDPAVNNGNWQWVASTGSDVQPYFRIFNPWSQQKKFDRECIYIKKWIPELRALSPKVIHEWNKKEHHTHSPKYPAPMLDHEKAAKEALFLFKKI